MTEDANRQPFRGIAIEEAHKRIADGGIQIVDVRPPFDFAGGHIPHSLNFPGQALRARAAQLRSDRELLVVDADGDAAGEACGLAVSLGFSAVSYLQGGFEAWLAAGYETHTISDSMAG